MGRGRGEAGPLLGPSGIDWPHWKTGKEFMVDIRVNSDPGTLPSIPLAFPPSTQTSLIAQSVKKSAYNTGAPSLIPGSGRSSGEGIGYPLQCSWASLVAQLVKNPPANERDLGVIPGLGRSKGKGYPLKSSILD